MICITSHDGILTVSCLARQCEANTKLKYTPNVYSITLSLLIHDTIAYYKFLHCHGASAKFNILY